MFEPSASIKPGHINNNRQTAVVTWNRLIKCVGSFAIYEWDFNRNYKSMMIIFFFQADWRFIAIITATTTIITRHRCCQHWNWHFEQTNTTKAYSFHTSHTYIWWGLWYTQFTLLLWLPFYSAIWLFAVSHF